MRGKQDRDQEPGATMTARAVTEHVVRISLRMVNVFLIVLPESLILVDAGTTGSFARIAGAVRGLGRRPEEITDIVVTHCHADHTGGLAEAQTATGAQVWMHPADAALVRAGVASRPWKPAPGSLTGLLARPFVGKGPSSIAAVSVGGEVIDGQTIPVAGGLLPVWTPGHTEGHLVYLWPRDGGVLFVGDAAARLLRLRPGPIYEDYQRGVQSLRTLAGLEFEAACFAHGRPIARGASRAFAKVWAPS
jgi:glyoxylase-like metal-dependent hydrolase (beta-lactamase superfamily II)